MAPLVAPGVCRFAVNQTFQGRAVVNVLDYRIDTTGGTMSRPEAIADQAEEIWDAWATEILEICVDDLVMTSVSWVDLDDLNGSTGENTTSDTNPPPQAGTSAGAPFPANVAALVDKVAGGGRGDRNGRIYVCGMAEIYSAAAAPNTIDGANLPGIQARFTNFLAQTNNEGPPTGDYQSALCVVRTRNIAAAGQPPNIVWVGNDDVTALTVQALLATQRRRLRG